MNMDTPKCKSSTITVKTQFCETDKFSERYTYLEKIYISRCKVVKQTLAVIKDNYGNTTKKNFNLA